MSELGTTFKRLFNKWIESRYLIYLRDNYVPTKPEIDSLICEDIQYK